jgi:hypothetical protein
MCVIYGCTVMTSGAHQPTSQGRASQPRAADIAAHRGLARCGCADGARLRDFAAPGLPLSRGSSSSDRAGAGRRPEDRLHRQTAPRPGEQSSRLCAGQTPIAERTGQPSVARVAGTEMSRWRSVQDAVTRSSWNTASIVCSRSNSNESTNCWCPTGADHWDPRRKLSGPMERN